MRKEFKKTGLRIDEDGNVFGGNGNAIYPHNGLYVGRYSIEEMMSECYPKNKVLNTFIAVAEKQLLKDHTKPKPVKPKSNGKRLIDQITKPMSNVTQSKNKGKSNPNFEGYYIIDGIEYDSLREASKATGLRPNNISRCCKLGMGFKPV